MEKLIYIARYCHYEDYYMISAHSTLLEAERAALQKAYDDKATYDADCYGVDEVVWKG